MSTKLKKDNALIKLIDFKITNDINVEMDTDLFLDIEKSERNIPNKFLKVKKGTFKKKIDEIESKNKRHIIQNSIFHIIVFVLLISLYVVSFRVPKERSWIASIVIYWTIYSMLIFEFIGLCLSRYKRPFYNQKRFFYTFLINIILSILLLTFSTIFQYTSNNIIYLIFSLITAITIFVLPVIWSELLQRINEYVILKKEIDSLSLQIIELNEIIDRKKSKIEILSIFIEIKNYYINKRLKLLNYYKKISYFKDKIDDEINLLNKEKDKMINSFELFVSYMNRIKSFTDIMSSKNKDIK